jgi:hypothetical protein
MKLSAAQAKPRVLRRRWLLPPGAEARHYAQKLPSLTTGVFVLYLIHCTEAWN